MKTIFAVIAAVAVLGSVSSVRAGDWSGVDMSKIVAQAQAGKESSRRTFIYPDEFSLINNRPVTEIHFFGLLGNAYTDENSSEDQACDNDAIALQAKIDAYAPGAASVTKETIMKSVGPSTTPTIDPANADATPGKVTVTQNKGGRVLHDGAITGQTSEGSYQKASDATLCAQDLVASSGHQIVFREVKESAEACQSDAQSAGVVAASYKWNGNCEMLTIK